MDQKAFIQRVTRRLTTLLAGAALAVAALAGAGSLLDLPWLAAFGAWKVPIPPFGIGLVAALGAALLMTDGRQAAVRGRRIAAGLALAVALLSLGVAAGHLWTRFVPLDHWLLAGHPQAQRTSLLTALATLGAALSGLLRWASPQPAWGRRQGAAVLAHAPMAIGVAVLVSHAAGAPMLYGSSSIPMSLPSALCALFLGLALLISSGCDTWPVMAFRLQTRTGDHRAPWFMAGPLSVFLLLGLLILTGGSVYLRGQLQTIRRQVHAELSAIAELKADQIEGWYRERQADADQVFHSPLLQAQLRTYLEGSGKASEQGLQAWMEWLQRGTYQGVVLADATGKVRISVPAESSPALQRLDREELDTVLRKGAVTVTDLHQDEDHPNLHLSLWVPVTGQPGGPPSGVLLLLLDPRKFLFPLVQTWPTPSPTSETLLVRREGEEAVFLNDLRQRPGSGMHLRVPLRQDSDMPAVRALLGAEGLIAGHDYRGVPVLAAVHRVAGTPWHMVAKVDEAEIYGPMRQRVWATAAGLMAMLALAAAMLGLMVRHHEAGLIHGQLVLSQRYEWLMREANDIILILDEQGRIQEANQRAIDHYGYSLEELRAMPVANLRAPEAQPQVSGQLALVKAQGALRFDTWHRHRDGSAFPVEVSSRLVHLDGEPTVISFVRDISERVVRDREIQRMSQLYAALSQVNQAIVWSPTRQVLFDKICEVMVTFGKFSMTWIGWVDPFSQVVGVAARYGDRTGMLDRVTVRADGSSEGQGAVGRAIRQESPCIINDFIGAEASSPWREELVSAGFASIAVFPIRQDGLVRGALAVYASDSGFFGAPEVALLEEAAMDISFALDHLAGEVRRQEAEAALMESERFLREAQEASGLGTYTWDIQADRWRSSPQLDRIFGIGPDHPRTLAGWVGIVAPEARASLETYVAGIIERREPFDLEYPIRHPDGARRWVHGRGELHWDEAGRPAALVGIIQDITERKQDEIVLRKVSVAVEQSPLSIVITDPQGLIEYVNPAFTASTGYTEAEAIGQNPRILRSPDTPSDHYRAMWETLLRGEVWMGEFENLKKGGERFFEHAIIAPVRDEHGELTGYIAIKEDITEQKRAEAERRVLEEQLHQSQKLESLGSLAGGVAHDMNNVLGAILGLASSMRDGADGASPAARSLDTIVNACLRGRGVVKSLLYFAKKDLQEERPVDLNLLVREMGHLLSHTTLKRVQLEMDLAEGLGRLVGDGGALSHALMNLCVNAMDAMPGGGIIRLSTRAAADGGLDLRVRDTGEGMSPEVLAKAMEPFFSTKPKGKGTGLGLAMVYGTVKAHDGTLELTSEPGRGTEAVLHFPASRVVPAPPPEPETQGADAEVQAPLRILLVDDDELIRESLGPMLEILGHRVTMAPDGIRALRLLEEGLGVDLVVLDMNMPGLSGAETLPRLRELRPSLPVIMATGYSDQEVTPLLSAHVGVDSIRKPFSSKEIELKIAAFDIHPAP